MRRSTSRILTTHTGSLPRPDDLVPMLQAKDEGQPVEEAAFQARVKSATADIVRQQVEAGIDVVNDGEAGKIGYATYVHDRLTGFGGQARPLGRTSLENTDFPEWAAQRFGTLTRTGNRPFMQRPSCNGPISLKDSNAVKTDIANLRAAVQGQRVEDVFMTAASPGVVSVFLPNEYYKTHEEYVHAVAAALREEYKAIVDAGFVLQLDCPDLAMGRNMGDYSTKSETEFLAFANQNVEALNEATKGLPREQVRVHLCWGNYEGPHNHDIALQAIWDTVTKANAAGVSYEACNPRHDHEWAFFEGRKLPPDTVLIPGVIDSTTNFVEHPELVAQRITRLAKLVGAEHVMAGSDCGFGTFAGMSVVDARITWAKMKTMAEGAAIASKQLYR
ncbi:MAG: cobalamin-independent methionine synthase II family protein [Chloroflexi bacterium]|nr:cobalamin-independent methionine synthase II family protein [Chloroflexota bacterium]